MAVNFKLANAAANAEANALATLLNTGYLRIYTGPQPATADTAISSQTLLAELRFGSTAFGSASAGVITANSISAGSSLANGTAVWARCLKSDGTTAVLDLAVDVIGADLVLTTTAITTGFSVSVSSLVYTVTE